MQNNYDITACLTPQILPNLTMINANAKLYYVIKKIIIIKMKQQKQTQYFRMHLYTGLEVRISGLGATFTVNRPRYIVFFTFYGKFLFHKGPQFWRVEMANTQGKQSIKRNISTKFCLWLHYVVREPGAIYYWAWGKFTSLSCLF